jgi:hypothetical protein
MLVWIKINKSRLKIQVILLSVKTPTGGKGKDK